MTRLVASEGKQVAGTLEDAFKAIDSLREEQAKFNLRLAETEAVSQYRQRDVNLLRRALVNLNNKINKKLDLLLKEYHQQQGRKNAISWIPIILGTMVNLSALAGTAIYVISTVQQLIQQVPQ